MISFVIPTNGKRPKALEVLLSSIVSQVERPEIIVLGPALNLPRNVVHIGCEYETNNGLLSAKLNTGCNIATNDIIVCIHDDMVLHEHFYKWFMFNDWDIAFQAKEVDILAPNYIYPNNYNFMGISQDIDQKKEHPLWTMGGPNGHRAIEFKDWDEHSYVSGESIIIAKSSWAKCPWEYDNDHRITRGTKDAYDVKFGHQANFLELKTMFDPRVALYHHRLESNFFAYDHSKDILA